MKDSKSSCINFKNNSENAWKDLQTQKSFYDITLASEDKEIKAHKIVISSFCPMFKNILKQNMDKHPLIYLRGVQSKELEKLLNFIYTGEVTIDEEDLDIFYQVGEDLKN